MKYLPVLFFVILCISCDSKNCDSLPAHYSSYTQAVNIIRHTHFKIHDTCHTSSSSWIRAAEYYSCDGQTGYFLFKTDKQWYIHAAVPISVWQEFKDAQSRGSSYDHYIKGRYRFNL
ncbi:MAG: KTSC domain-containing protein [Thermoflavifilum sp.]|nr:KTSC domain-containing protein [Thermoflavifilum sp.]